jgi:hypothetical protein
MISRGLGVRTIVAAVVAAVALLGLAAGAQAKTRKAVGGVVVHRNQHAGSFVVANGKGHLFAIHSASSSAVGTKVHVALRRLKNGTYSATSTRLGKHHPHVRVHGTVSHVSASGDSYTVSSRGVSLLVETRSGAKAPAVGTIVTVTGSADEDQNEGEEDQNEGNIEEEDLQEEGEDNNGFVLEGTIVEINELERTLTVSSDDDQESGETVTVHVPPALDISLFTINEEVELNVKPLEGGGFELLGSADDEGEQGAENGEDEQGEQGEEGEGEQGEQ